MISGAVQKSKGLFLLLVVGAAMAIFHLFVTFPYKMGLSPDGACYLTMAQDIASGRGASVPTLLAQKFVPVVTYSPLLSGILSIAFRLHLNIPDVTWVFNSFVFGLTIFLAACFVYDRTQSVMAAIGLSTILFFDPHWEPFFGYVLTEPLFLCLGIAAIFCLGRYSNAPRVSWLLLASISIGLSAVTRYVGAAYIPAGALCIFLFSEGDLFTKIRRTFLQVVVSSLPLAFWVLRNRRLTGGFFGVTLLGQTPQTNLGLNIRSVLADTAGYPRDFQGVGTIYFLLAAAVLLMISGVVYCLGRGPRAYAHARSVIIVGSFALSYTALLTVLLTMQHANGNPEKVRYILPIFGALWPFLVLSVHAVQTDLALRHRTVRVLFLAALAGLLILCAWNLVYLKRQWVQDTVDHGADYSRGERWRDFYDYPYPLARMRMMKNYADSLPT